MPTTTDPHAAPVNPETPSQGIFIGWLALALLAFALLFAAFTIYAGSTYNFS